ncbi:MAG: SDR family oxidoreductase [Rhizobiaceae bacterium]|nr:SDR family oxidoreductase [Rhizobiaceae bacterium]
MYKTALVTGGAQRIGRSICLGLADAGYAVSVHHNSSNTAANDLVAQINSNDGHAVPVQADLSNSREARGLIDRTVAELGPVGLLVNNASLFEEDSLDKLDDEVWDRHFAVHVKAPAILASAFSEQGIDDGLIINMIDERVWKLTPNFTSYTLSKSALWTATQTMAQALAPNIRVNAIGPGPTLPSHVQTQDAFEEQLQTLLLKRAPDLSEFIDTILYFVSAKSVTGQMIALDGGQHLGWRTSDQAPAD